MEKFQCILFAATIVICFVNTNGLLGMNSDCRTQEGGPYYFKKISSRKYKCFRHGPEYECPDTWAIPSWYKYDSTDPCLCMSVPSIYGKKFFCPKDPMFGYRTTESPVTESPVVGAIADSGCPDPFRRYPDTRRVYNESSALAEEIPITGDLGFMTAENECKFHCLARGLCAGATYSEEGGVPLCVVYYIVATSYDLRISPKHNYFEKVWCVVSSFPVMPTPPPIENGLMLMNTAQETNGKLMFADIDELSCYTWCFYERTCAAVDYKKMSGKCIYFKETSCEAHSPAIDQDTNHYKKRISKC